ncbi:MAG: NIPSNAP family protein [Saprospiraceae bacterium]|nr:NIPSNAP family protein [Saprospiraceae bacterium]
MGVFSKIGNDTALSKQIFVLVPSRDLNGLLQIDEALANHDMHLKSGLDYWSTGHDRPAYDRIESSLLGAFRFHQQLKEPKLKSPKAVRVYELRSYEAASEKLYRKKVEMFNEGGEIDIFNELNFNAVFYAETLIGAHYPNLVYMTTFENMDDRNKHWDAFRSAPAWKELSAKEEFKNTVSKADIYLLTPMQFSDL